MISPLVFFKRNSKFILLLFLILPAFSTVGQEKIPRKITKSPQKLANHLTIHLNDENDITQTIHNWITNNIRYDIKKENSSKVIEEELSNEVLKCKKATCTGYSNLMKDMLNSRGIDCELVDCYVNEHLKDSVTDIVLENHRWVAVKIRTENNKRKWYSANFK